MPLHLRIPRRAAAGLAAAASLIAAAPAAAGSIAYIKGGDVWIASPDGSKKVQVTRTGDLSSVSQADDGTMIALAPNDRLRKLSHTGRTLAEFPTFASDGPNVPGAIDRFSGPFDPQISPNGRLVAFTWFNDSYGSSGAGSCGGVAGCYERSSRKGVGITRSDKLTAYDEYGLLTGWEYPDWVDDDTLLRSYSQANLNEDTVFNQIAPGKGDDALDRWFYDEDGGGTVRDVEMTPDRRVAVGIVGNGDKLWVYRTLREPFGAPDWKFSFFDRNDNVPVVQHCYQLSKPVGGRFTGLSLSPDGKQLAYAVGNGIWVADVADIANGCGKLPARNGLKLPGGSSPDWGPAGVPSVKAVKGGGSATLRSAGPTRLRTALRKGLRVRVKGVADGTVISARRKHERVAAGRVLHGRARLVFGTAARRSLRRKRSVRLTVVVAGGARTKLTLTR